ncbi:rna-directed dna polymerase from mobile element jockey-like [Willisornis vidua]|uniref:Rna-directed dna polymerase from mobile element jockey-like n=1 Tax=Willisornis vidua TaxID=1566151 RepID=A0ABQ9CWG8_9PASS|nr:rna-directed dna polymerase from mobile element jockey-like [Willisornis vidua]
MRKAKAHLELSLAKDIKDNKGLYKSISSKRKARENVGLLLNQKGVLVMEDTEKVELLNSFLASVFTAKGSPQESQTWEVREECWGREDFRLVVEGWIRDELDRLNTHESMGPDRTHLWLLRELVDDFGKPPSIIFENLWTTEEVPDAWRNSNVTPIFEKGEKADLEKLPASQPHLHTWKGDGTDDSRGPHQVCKRKESHWE